MFWRALAVLLLATVVTVLTLPLEEPRLRASSRDAADVVRPRQRRDTGDDDTVVNLNANNRDSAAAREVRVRRNAHAEAAGDEKKRAFQPWGGKRQAELPEAAWDAALGGDEDAALVARAFNPWGGKRGDDGAVADKRKFNPWGGKRDAADSAKRAFQPWGGKRQAPSLDDLKRRFNPWAGKRSPMDVIDGESPLEEDDDADDEFGADAEKRAFNPWGGKRASFNPWGGKRASFNPWGGKRASFQPWGGKRASFQPWGGKRASFQPWGGKRAVAELARDLEEAKRQAFQPWAGKRSGSRDTEHTNVVQQLLHPAVAQEAALN